MNGDDFWRSLNLPPPMPVTPPAVSPSKAWAKCHKCGDVGYLTPQPPTPAIGEQAFKNLGWLQVIRRGKLPLWYCPNCRRNFRKQPKRRK